MSKLQRLRELVDQRRAAVVEDILGLFESTIADCEEEIYRSQEENVQLKKLLKAASKPEDHLRAGIEESEEEEEGSTSLDQEEPKPQQIKEEPKPPHIKEEQEEKDKLQKSLDAVKSKDDEKKAKSSQLFRSRTKKNRGAEAPSGSSAKKIKTEKTEPKPAKNVDPGSHLQAASDDKASDLSEPVTEDSEDDLLETREPHSGVKVENDMECGAGKKERSRQVKGSGNRKCTR